MPGLGKSSNQRKNNHCTKNHPFGLAGRRPGWVTIRADRSSCMTWLNDTLDMLTTADGWCYQSGAEVASEPTALAALALAGHGRTAASHAACRWLVEHQNDDGSVGVTASQNEPTWPTGLAVLAWTAADRPTSSATVEPGRYAANVQRAVEWILTHEGHTLPQAECTGHDTTLRGWPWVEGTHSWIEPTATNLLALRSTGHCDHPRAREAVVLLLNRLLSQGGCNYGNTSVLGQDLVPHLEPTGLAMIALAGERDPSGRVERSLEYLEVNLSPRTTAASLAYAVLGLAAHGRTPSDLDARLSTAAEQTLRRGASPPRRALLALAALGEACPLIALTRKSSTWGAGVSRTSTDRGRASPGQSKYA